MDDLFSQTWQEIIARPSGQFAMRFYLQPLVATVLAVRDGMKDARTGSPVFLWTVVSDPAHRGELLRSAWKSIGKVFVMALVLDVVYQLVVLGGLRPLAGIFIAVLLAIIPYVIVRGPVSRLMRGTPKGKPA